MIKRHKALLVRIAYALVLVLIAARAYQQAVYYDVALVDLPIRKRPAAGGEVSIKLPNMAPLRGSVPVLVFQFRNAGTEARQIAITLNGFPQARVTVAPGAQRRFDLALSKSTGDALSVGVPWLLQLRGSGGGWSLQSLAARSYHARLDHIGVIVPSGYDRFTRVAPWGSIPVLLVLFAATVAARTRIARPRLTTALMAMAGAVLTALSMAAEVSPFHVLISRPVFWLLVGVAFLPGCASLARLGGAVLLALTRSGRAFWRRHPTTLERLSALLGLCALALAQPVFEVLSPSPEFFAARNTTVDDVLLAIAAVCIGLPLLLTAIEWSLRRFSPRAGTFFFMLMVTLLTSALLLPWVKRAESLQVAGSFAVAIGGGALLALGALRLPAVGQFLSALAPAAIVLPALFLLNGQVQRALIPVRGVANGPVLARTPPMVIVVFDELPLSSLLDVDGRLDAERFPNFAAFAGDAFWFRRASTVSPSTVWAVPAIASGRYPSRPGSVPTLRYYPDNLFTFLSDRYEMSIFGRFLQLCPEARCQYDLFVPGESVSALLEDLGIVWLHVALPEPLTSSLPSVVGDWAGFAQGRRWRKDDGQLQRNHRGGEFDRFLASIDGRPARLNFLHTLLPHMPFEYVPSGRRYQAMDHQGRKERGMGLFWRASPAYVDAVHQRHLLQVAYVDHLVGRLVARLRALGAYDEALVVITADHGASYKEGTSRRSPRGTNLADIMLVPLFVKLPGQTHGEAIDRNVENVDLLPTIADVVGTPLPFEVDGRSLLDQNPPERTLKRIFDVGPTKVRVREVTQWEPLLQRSLARKHARFGAGDQARLYSTPGTQALLGAALNRVDAVSVRGPAELSIGIDGVQRFGEVDLAADFLPLEVRGRIRGATPPLALAVAVNGVVVATTVSYEQQERHVFSTMIPDTSLRQGANDVRVFQIDAEATRVTTGAAN